jgi:hypothetical protein
MVELVRGRVWFEYWVESENEGRSWVKRLERRGPKREEVNARMKAMERKRKMDPATERSRTRERGEEVSARVAGVCGERWLCIVDRW